MNRLLKKCVIATVGFHLLLLVILFVGPAFFNSKPKEDDAQVLDVIPANLIDAAFNSGVKNAQPPAPTPIVTPPQPQPTPPAPKPDLTPPKKIDLTPVVRTVPKNSTTPNQQDNSRQQQQRQKAFQNAVKNLKNNFTPSTTVEMPGDSSVAYANYASVVKSVYDQAWTLPDTVANDDEIVKVSVTIASDGTVITAHIITASGDSPVDSTVQRTLDRVQFIQQFPLGSTDKERTYIINFNPKAKRILE